jgi:hypothetical protein
MVIMMMTTTTTTTGTGDLQLDVGFQYGGVSNSIVYDFMSFLSDCLDTLNKTP